MRPLQPGDALDTYADSSRLARAVNWRPATPVAEGVRRFADWYVALAPDGHAPGRLPGRPLACAGAAHGPRSSQTAGNPTAASSGPERSVL